MIQAARVNISPAGDVETTAARPIAGMPAIGRGTIARAVEGEHRVGSTPPAPPGTVRCLSGVSTRWPATITSN